MRVLLATTMTLPLTAVPVAANAPHPCASQAVEQALKLLKFHSDVAQGAEVFRDRAKWISTIKALRGRGRFDVIEVPGAIYKATYRMRLIYARIHGDCVLMGQEVIEESDPY